jgi:hypothetical protein
LDSEGLQARQVVLMRRALCIAAMLLMPWWLSAANAAEPATLPGVVLYAPSPCLACIDWADHLRQSGFTVTLEEKLQADMPKIKRWLNVPSALESVHTAKVGRYFIEGHVPAQDILLLLQEKPNARGLAVPGLPGGAPGRESYNPICDTACTILDNAGQPKEIRREAFNTMLVGPDGRSSVYARH